MAWIKTVNSDNSATYKPIFSLSLIKCFLEEGKSNSFKVKTQDVFVNFVILCWISAGYYKFRQNPTAKDKSGIDKWILPLIEDFKKTYKLPDNDECAIKDIKKVKNFITNEYDKNKNLKELKAIFKNGPYKHFGKNLEIMKKHEKNNKPFQIEIDEEKYLIIKKWKKILINESIFRWAELVEKYNHSVINPIQKIDSFKEINGVKRDTNTFTTHKRILQEFYIYNNQSDEIKCFYDSISLKEISWDHYIPHSYMSYEDIWNLVPTSISLNSSKSNKYHDKFFNDEIIEKLYKRNNDFHSFLINEKERLIKEKKFKELDLEKIIFQFNSWKELKKIKSKVEEFKSFDCI